MMPTPRRGVVEFSVSMLCDLLEPYAKLKVAPFADWECSLYAKSRRGQGPDRQGLETYHLLLKCILNCPSARPSHVRLREAWLYLHKKHSIMHKELQLMSKDPVAWADEVADRLKVMLRHLLDLVDSTSTFVTPPVRELMSMVDDSAPPPTSAASSDPVLALPPPTPSMLALTDDDKPMASQCSAASSSDDVIFCGMTCNCPQCKKVIPVSQESATSVAAKKLAGQSLLVPRSSSRRSRPACRMRR